MTPVGTSERGVSLVELLLAVVICGIVSVGLLGALTTVSIASDRARKTSDSFSVLYTAADAIQTLAYNASCPASYSVVNPAGFPASASNGTSGMRVSLADVSVTSIEYWNGATARFGSSCTPALAAGDPGRLQRITLRALLADGRVDRTLQVVKRG